MRPRRRIFTTLLLFLAAVGLIGTFAPSPALATAPPPGVSVIWADGTGGGHNAAVANPVVDGRDVVIVDYPQAFRTKSSGNTPEGEQVPTYQESRDIGARNAAALIKAQLANPCVKSGGLVVAGFSQGGDVVITGVEIAVSQGLITEGDKVVVYAISDPRNPWGEGPGRQTVPYLKLIEELRGGPVGARNPADTGTVPISSVIITGDTIANFQHIPGRPVANRIVEAAGGLVHGMGYEDPSAYGEPYELKSVEGNTTYLVYRSYHPVVEAPRLVLSRVGVGVPRVVLDAANTVAQRWYPISEPAPENAAVPVYDPVRSPTISTRSTPTPETGDSPSPAPVSRERASTDDTGNLSDSLDSTTPDTSASESDRTSSSESSDTDDSSVDSEAGAASPNSPEGGDDESE